MNKVKLGFKIPENVIIEHNGEKISVTPYLTVAQMVYLINGYLNEFFSGSTENKIVTGPKYRYFEAEINLKSYILQMVTNVDLESLDNELYGDVELWDKIFGGIKNYSQCRAYIEQYVQLVKEEITLDTSLGVVLSNLIEKGSSLLDKLGDITPEEIEKLQKTGANMIEQLQKSNLLEDAIKMGVEKEN